jgi:hypothetical protein
MNGGLPAVVELLSRIPTIEAMPDELRESLAAWTEDLGAIGWPDPRFVKTHPERPGRPPCCWVVGIRWSGERCTVAVTEQWPPSVATLIWVDGCPIPPPIMALRWMVGR